jgi:hypothetical protein
MNTCSCLRRWRPCGSRCLWSIVLHALHLSPHRVLRVTRTTQISLCRLWPTARLVQVQWWVMECGFECRARCTIMPATRVGCCPNMDCMPSFHGAFLKFALEAGSRWLTAAAALRKACTVPMSRGAHISLPCHDWSHTCVLHQPQSWPWCRQVSAASTPSGAGRARFVPRGCFALCMDCMPTAATDVL